MAELETLKIVARRICAGGSFCFSVLVVVVMNFGQSSPKHVDF